MQCLLALDCSADECSLALSLDGSVVAHREFPARQASEGLLDHVERLLDSCNVNIGDLTALAVGIGPGAFTGIRLAVATVQGLALSRGLLIYPISTLAAIAWQQGGARADALPILVLQDARMNEVYAGWYQIEPRGVRALSSEIVASPAQVIRPSGVDKFNIAGNAFAIYEEDVVATIGEPENVFRLGQIALGIAALASNQSEMAGKRPELVEPSYVRSKVALTSLEQQALRMTS